jgi:[NiFe] hydrogenase diaphorase moiety small subunit
VKAAITGAVMTQKMFMLDGMPTPLRMGRPSWTAMAAGCSSFHNFVITRNSSLRQPWCTVKASGRFVSACTTQARDGMEVENNTPDLNDKRRTMLQMLFVEGNHFCPSCEKSGHCMLQALAYELEMLTPHFEEFYPDRPVDASHPEVLLDFNRCILCELCVRASRDVDGKSVLLYWLGLNKHLIVNAESGRLGDWLRLATVPHVCPVGVILRNARVFAVPIGQRR